MELVRAQPQSISYILGEGVNYLTVRAQFYSEENEVKNTVHVQLYSWPKAQLFTFSRASLGKDYEYCKGSVVRGEFVSGADHMGANEAVPTI